MLDSFKKYDFSILPRTFVKSAVLKKNIFLFLNRFELPKHMLKIDGEENVYNFTLKMFVYTRRCYGRRCTALVNV